MNPAVEWSAVTGAVLLLPAGAALACGWAPARHRQRLARPRPTGWSLLLLSAALLLDALPQALNAPTVVADICAGLSVLPILGLVTIVLATTLGPPR
ncbi:hypothetical protein ACFVH7_11910 [Kitasatospora indigofera]|uniref:hypothetical protein n=1 Tax=Kitasatospora indigofera TaxID=67307 RepID=UPI003628FAE8